MDRVPRVVFSFLRLTKEEAYRVGMVGCGLQLTDLNEFDWPETTISLSPSREVRTFLEIEGIPYDSMPTRAGIIRIGILQFEEYLKYYESIKDFLDRFDRLKLTRLGSSSVKEPWELNSQEHHILMMDDPQFLECFIPDPRGRLSFSELLRGITLHKPFMKREPEGYPQVPQHGGWIRSISPAVT